MGCLTVFFRHAIWFRKSKQKQQQQWKQIETCSANVSDCLSVCVQKETNVISYSSCWFRIMRVCAHIRSLTWKSWKGSIYAYVHGSKRKNLEKMWKKCGRRNTIKTYKFKFSNKCQKQKQRNSKYITTMENVHLIEQLTTLQLENNHNWIQRRCIEWILRERRSLRQNMIASLVSVLVLFVTCCETHFDYVAPSRIQIHCGLWNYVFNRV